MRIWTTTWCWYHCDSFEFWHVLMSVLGRLGVLMPLCVLCILKGPSRTRPLDVEASGLSVHEQDSKTSCHMSLSYICMQLWHIYILYKYVYWLYWLCLLIITNQICTISVLYISLNAEVSYKIPVARGSKELSRVVSELFRLASLASLTDFYNINTPFVSFGLI